jgi:hypothetical protein
MLFLIIFMYILLVVRKNKIEMGMKAYILIFFNFGVEKNAGVLFKVPGTGLRCMNLDNSPCCFWLCRKM